MPDVSSPWDTNLRHYPLGRASFTLTSSMLDLWGMMSVVRGKMFVATNILREPFALRRHVCGLSGQPKKYFRLSLTPRRRQVPVL